MWVLTQQANRIRTEINQVSATKIHHKCELLYISDQAEIERRTLKQELKRIEIGEDKLRLSLKEASVSAYEIEKDIDAKDPERLKNGSETRAVLVDELRLREVKEIGSGLWAQLEALLQRKNQIFERLRCIEFVQSQINRVMRSDQVDRDPVSYMKSLYDGAALNVMARLAHDRRKEASLRRKLDRYIISREMLSEHVFILEEWITALEGRSPANLNGQPRNPSPPSSGSNNEVKDNGQRLKSPSFRSSPSMSMRRPSRVIDLDKELMPVLQANLPSVLVKTLFHVAEELCESTLFTSHALGDRDVENAMTGASFVSWLVKKGITKDRRTALILGDLLIAFGFIDHVELDPHLQDSNELYHMRVRHLSRGGLHCREKSNWGEGGDIESPHCSGFIL